MPRSFLGPMSFLGGRVSLSPMFLLVVGYPGGGIVHLGKELGYLELGHLGG